MTKKLVDAEKLIAWIEAAIPLSRRGNLGDAAILETVVEFIKNFDAEPQDPKPRKYLIRYKYGTNRNGRRHTGEANAVYTINDGKEFSEVDIEEFLEWAKSRHEWCDGVVMGTIFELAS